MNIPKGPYHYSVKGGLQEVNRYIKRLFSKNSNPLRTLFQSLSYAKGKEIRPQIVIQVAVLLGSPISNEKMYRAAAFISLLHNASLIHDDVIDQAIHRRYNPTLNQKLGNKKAVLYGDYLLTVILNAAIHHKDYEYVSLLTTTIQEMVEGELLQLNGYASPPNKTMYFKIIKKKTASLFGAACAMGAIAAAAPKQEICTFYKIGKEFGIAFQLYDDMLDYSHSTVSGKMPLMDIKNNLFTLPLLYTLEQATNLEKQLIAELIESYNTNKDFTTLEQLLKIIKRKGGMAYTYEKLSQQRCNALASLQRNVPSYAARKALIDIFEQTIPGKEQFKKMDLL